MKFLISHVIQHQLKDPRIGLITVLDVIPTADLKEAKVYVSVFGSAGDRSKAEHAMHGARVYIQNEVGQNLETRNTPILRFVFDDSAEKVSRIEGLIQKASQEDRESTMAKKPSKKTRKPEFADSRPSPINEEPRPIDEEEGDETSNEESEEYEAKGEDDFDDDDFDDDDSDDADIDLDEDFEEEEDDDFDDLEEEDDQDRFDDDDDDDDDDDPDPDPEKKD